MHDIISQTNRLILSQSHVDSTRVYA